MEGVTRLEMVAVCVATDAKENSANNLLLNKGKYHCTADICFTDLDLVVLLNTNKNIVW